ncbi:hypothetical protein Efla_004231 [Eimeria flavescens]
MSVRGGAGWRATYCKQFGKERWKLLLNALAEAPSQIAFVSPTISHSALRYLLRRPRFSPCFIPNCFIPASVSEGPTDNAVATSDAASDPMDFASKAGPEASETDGSELGEQAVSDGLSSSNTAVAEPELNSTCIGGQTAADEEPILDDCHVVEEAREMIYFLDGASALAAYALGAKPGEVVLDMCAAPGGKALIISSMLTSARVPRYLVANHSLTYQENSEDDETEEGGMLVCNDASRGRLLRSGNLCILRLPSLSAARRQRLQFSCSDGCKGGAFERFAPYDKILLDAPCSSDRHLLHRGGSALANWSTSTPKACAERQLKMLLIASKLLRKDGILLYTTCSLSHTENEAVIEKFLRKTKGGIKVLSLFDGEWPPDVQLLEEGASALDLKGSRCNSFILEKLEHGYTMLPDVSKFGPMYFCKMQVLGG